MEQTAVNPSMAASPWQGLREVDSRLHTSASSDWLEGLSITVFSSPEEAEADWIFLESFASVPFADRAWSQTWYRGHADDPDVQPVLVGGRDQDGKPLFLLPLVCEWRGPFKVLAWAGATHSAYHCGLFTPECRRQVTSANAKAFWKKVFAKLKGYDALVAFGLPSFEIATNNPLSKLFMQECCSSSNRMLLQEDWDELYLAKTKSKSRNRDRRRERQLAECGTVHYNVAETSEERQKLLAALIAQKSERFEEQGVANFFEDSSIRAFYEEIIESENWDESRSVFLSAVEVDGEPIAVNLGIIQESTFHGMVLSMSGGEFERLSPGRILLVRTMEHLCRKGLKVLDFGVGADQYKDSWCDEAIDRANVLVPLNTKGQLYISGLKLFLRGKDSIKQSPRLWSLFSRCRRVLGN